MEILQSPMTKDSVNIHRKQQQILTLEKLEPSDVWLKRLIDFFDLIDQNSCTFFVID